MNQRELAESLLKKANEQTESFARICFFDCVKDNCPFNASDGCQIKLANRDVYGKIKIIKQWIKDNPKSNWDSTIYDSCKTHEEKIAIKSMIDLLKIANESALDKISVEIKMEEKLTKFKVGDKVRFVKALDLNIPEKFFNMDLEISNVLDNNWYGIKEYDTEFTLGSNWFRGAVLKLVEPELTNEDKIKELDEALKCGNEYFEELAKIRKENNDKIKADIEELRKPTHELFLGNPSSFGSCYWMNNGLSSKGCSNDNYNRFAVDCGYYAKQRQMFDALANFAAHNDPAEKNREWNGDVGHYFVLKTEGKWDIGDDYYNYDPTTVYFSTKKLAQSALEMLKREGLV